MAIDSGVRFAGADLIGKKQAGRAVEEAGPVAFISRQTAAFRWPSRQRFQVVCRRLQVGEPDGGDED